MTIERGIFLTKRAIFGVATAILMLGAYAISTPTLKPAAAFNANGITYEECLTASQRTDLTAEAIAWLNACKIAMAPMPDATPTDTPSATPTPTTEPTPTAGPTVPPVPVNTDTYTTLGRRLIDPWGMPVNIRMIEQSHWRAPWISTSWMTEIGKTGANAARSLTKYTISTPTGDPKSTLADIEAIIKLGIQAHMVVDVAVDDGKLLSTWLRPEIKALMVKYQKYILVHAKGESYENTRDLWAANAITTVTQLRAAGYNMPLYILSNQGGRDLRTIMEKGQQVLDADPKHNLIFGFQAYWGDNNAYQNSQGTPGDPFTLTEAMYAVAALPFPVQVGLLHRSDPQDNAPWKVPYQNMMALCQQLAIDWAWWDWRIGIDNLSVDGIYGDGHWYVENRGAGADGSPLGKTVAITDPNSIANTSVRTPWQMAQVAPA